MPPPPDDSPQAQAVRPSALPPSALPPSALPQGAELLGSARERARAALLAWAAPELAFGPQVRVVVSLPVFGLEVRFVVAEPVFGPRGQEPERPDALAAPGPEFEPALAALKAWGALAGFA
jgi:hypothetical protein